MRNKEIRVTIGIPIYKSSNNIKSLITSLLNQKQENFKIQQIMAYIDAPKDKTVDMVKELSRKNKKIVVFDMKNRRGMAYGVEYMLKRNKSDVFVLINDDVAVNDLLLVSRLSQPFIKNKKIGLVSGNPQPLPATNFITAAGISTFRAFERTRYSFLGGNNKMTCDGKLLAISKDMLSRIKFPKDKSKMGNVDAYLYFSNIIEGFTYKHVRKAVVFFEFPNNLSDYIKWTTRNNSNKLVMKKRFGEIVDKEYEIPKQTHAASMFYQMIKNPLGAVFIFLIGLFAKQKSISYANKFESTWKVVSSTKKVLKIQ